MYAGSLGFGIASCAVNAGRGVFLYNFRVCQHPWAPSALAGRQQNVNHRDEVMEIIPTRFPGLWLIQPRVFQDNRGFFAETYNEKDFISHGIYYDFVQDNHARSERKGVLRGLHFQTPPAAQAKLVRVTRGAVFDVVVDFRKGSPTYGNWYGEELSGKNFRQLLIPKGFAHGYVTLEPMTEFQYKVDAFYAPEHDAGVLWNDPTIAIPWPVDQPVLSEKDQGLPLMKDFESPFAYVPV